MNQNQRIVLPTGVIVAVCLLTAIPSLLGLIGLPLNAIYNAEQSNQILSAYPSESVDRQLLAYLQLTGPFIHTILEWTACCLAMVTGLFSFIHYRMKQDVTTPTIGTALFFSGMLDGFIILAADRITFPVADLVKFIPFTWAISRTFNIAILLGGTFPFVVRSEMLKRRPQPQEIRYLILVSVLFGLMAYAIIQIFAVVVEVPNALFPASRLPRPWDLLPLILWSIAGLAVFPLFWKKQKSLFAHSLLISAIPAVAVQIHMAFGSTQLFDHHFFCAYLLKILAYAVLLIGLVFDYGAAHQAGIQLQETQTKLENARQIADSLLPSQGIDQAGLEAAGFSYSTDAVGGDYYDFLPLSGDRIGLVVGDVSGHDLAASILVSQARAYLRAYSETLDDLGMVMSRLNRALVRDTQQRRFITMFCVQVDLQQSRLRYVAAGHQGYLLKKKGELITLDSDYLPLGMIDQDQMEQAIIQPLETGDQLLIVTDGITEAVSSTGEQYGLTRIINFLRKHESESTADLIQQLRADVDRFCGGQPPFDDITVVLMRWRGKRAKKKPRTRS